MAETFGPYRLDALLGRGGMGEVFRAYDTRRRRTVALKRLRPGTSAEESFRERFRRESELAARLNAPHVIPIHDFGEIDGHLFLDMRLVEGRDLATVLADDGRLTPPDAVAVIGQLASALDAAHAAGLLHRDVKPANALVDAGGFVYLVDFGIVKSLDGEEGHSLTSGVIGTPAYLAPERFAGVPGDRRSDVYALACVLHECLTGHRPFPSDTPMRAMHGHVHGEIPRPSATDPALAAFDAVVARGLAKDPAERCATAGDLAAAARAALSRVGASAALTDLVTPGAASPVEAGPRTAPAESAGLPGTQPDPARGGELPGTRPDPPGPAGSAAPRPDPAPLAAGEWPRTQPGPAVGGAWPSPTRPDPSAPAAWQGPSVTRPDPAVPGGGSAAGYGAASGPPWPGQPGFAPAPPGGWPPVGTGAPSYPFPAPPSHGGAPAAVAGSPGTSPAPRRRRGLFIAAGAATALVVAVTAGVVALLPQADVEPGVDIPVIGTSTAQPTPVSTESPLAGVSVLDTVAIGGELAAVTVAPDGTVQALTARSAGDDAVFRVDPFAPGGATVVGDALDVSLAGSGLAATRDGALLVTRCAPESLCEVSRIDRVTGENLAYVGVGHVLVGPTPTTVALDAAGQRLYVLLFQRQPGGATTTSVEVIDLDRMQSVGAPFPVRSSGLGGFALDPDGRTLWIADGVSAVTTVDAVSGALLGAVDVGRGATDLAVSPDGSRVWVANAQDGTVVAIDTDTLRVTGDPVPVGADPARVAVSADGAAVWVADRSGGTVSVLDAATGAVVGDPVPVGPDTAALAVPPVGTQVWVADALDGTLRLVGVPAS